jgi:hypothetical protein
MRNIRIFQALLLIAGEIRKEFVKKLLNRSLDPRFAGSNPFEDNAFLRAIKICGTTSFRGKARPSAHVVRFYCILNNPAEYEKDTSSAKFTRSLSQVY